MHYQATTGLAIEDMQMIADEGEFKLTRYRCARTVVIHKWHTYIVEWMTHGDCTLLVVRDDINQILGVRAKHSPPLG